MSSGSIFPASASVIIVPSTTKRGGGPSPLNLMPAGGGGGGGGGAFKSPAAFIGGGGGGGGDGGGGGGVLIFKFKYFTVSLTMLTIISEVKTGFKALVLYPTKLKIRIPSSGILSSLKEPFASVETP